MTDARVDRLNAALEGRYRIDRELGEGGMATVYLANDLRHERKVALKVLKPELAAVVGAERFLAEIKVTASLQHPNILPLHDSGESDGFLFYVMPYVEGDTLRDRLDREHQLPVADAVDIATDIAEALDYAHRQGVIHRDVKPANVLMLEGKPVISDFGIALAVGTAGGGRLTETGLSLGTPHYMSPEQATGDQFVGSATDIYALGSVLYEMLVGEPAYPGSTAQAVLGKIIAGKPVSATEQRPSIPANVDAAVRCALEKLPADRFTSAQDFARALGDDHFRYGEPVGAGSGPGSGPWSRLTVAFAALAAGLALVLGWSQLRPEPAVLVERYSLARDRGQVPNEWMSLSPDGSTMVMTYPDDSGQLRLWWRRWDDLNATLVPGVGGPLIVDPIISPDGLEVAFTTQAEVLQVAPLGGGVLRTLTDSANCCMRWGPDGFLYYSTGGRGIYRVPAAGGAVEQITRIEREGDVTHGYFQVLPGGEVAVFTVWAETASIEAMRMSTGERVELTEGVRAYVTPTGHLVFASLDGRILAAPFDPDAMELTGAPVPLVEEVGMRNDDAMFSLSETGDLLYWSTGSQNSESEFVWVTRAGVATPVDPGWTFDPGGANWGWSLSPDGTRLAYRDMSDDVGEIWIKDLDDGPLARFTFDAGADWSPRWAPDRQNVTFLSDREGDRDLWSKRADGTGEPTLWLDFARPIATGFWSPDGEWLVFRTNAQAGLISDILGFRPGVDTVPLPLVATPASERGPALSPDGRWLAYASDETGTYEIYVRPFPDVDAGQFQVSLVGGVAPVWAHSGRELFFFGYDQNLHAAEIETAPRFRVVGVESLFEVGSAYGGQTNVGWYDIAPDDREFLMARPYQGGDGESVAAELILVRNWFEELTERVGN